MKEFPNGVKKALTFSFDDGVMQDIRLINLLDKYNLKATFNLNSGLLGKKDGFESEGRIINTTKVNSSDVKEIYKNHEVAVHTLTHPLLTELSDEEVIREIEEDRLRLSELAGYEVFGFAFPNPYGKIKDFTHLSELAKKTGVKYARTTVTTHSFEPCTDLFALPMSVHTHDMKKTFELSKEFVALKTDTPKVFYIMSHAYEYDIDDNWDELEELFKLLSNRDDIYYGTNKEIYL